MNFENKEVFKFLYVILGFILGVIGPIIVKYFSDRKKSENLKKSVISELKEVKKRIAGIPYLVYPEYGKLDSEKWEWIKKNVDISDIGIDYEQLEKEEIMENINIVEYLNGSGNKKIAKHFKKINFSSFNSSSADRGLLDSEFLEKIIKVNFRIVSRNEDIDSYRETLKMTFIPDIIDRNDEILSKELENKALWIAKESMTIVDEINKII